MSLVNEIIRNRYKIIRELGGGGFGVTYLAEDLDFFNNQVVVKHLQPQNPSPQVLTTATRLFEREAKTLYSLGKHDQIPHLYAYFQEDDEFYLVQEFVDGHDLSEEIIPGKPLSEDKTVQLLIDILEVLEFIHQENVIHRDLKPANIMRREQDNKLILIDFGAVKEISTLSTNSQGQTTTTTVIGTPGYMPNEQNHGHPKLSSDVYAVGMVAIKALTGISPKKLEKDSGTLEVIWRDRANVSDSLAKVLNKMVKSNYRDRYQTASEALEALNTYNASETLKTYNTSETPKTYNTSETPKTYNTSEALNNNSQHRSFPLISYVNNFWANRRIVFLSSLVLVPLVLFGSSNLIKTFRKNQFGRKVTLSSICSSTEDFISCGEEILDKNNPPWNKKQGVDLFSEGKYQEAVKYFQKSWEKSKDTETLIYLNNALLQAKKAKYYTIAVLVPILKNEDGTVKNTDLAQEILRGVAHAQTQINLGLFDDDELPENFPGKHLPSEQENKDFGLQVIIADDFNVEQESEKRAEVLSKEEDILGIVGSYTSDMTMASVDIYNGNELILISYGTTTKDLTERPRDFFFRVVGNTDFEAESLVTYLIQMGQKKAAVFYNTQSPYASSLYDRFETRFQNKGGTIVTTNANLSQENFNPKDAIKRITNDTAIVLLPDGQVTNSRDNALEIIKANKGRNWIATGSPIYSPKTLETGDAKLFEKVIIYTSWHRNDNETFSSDARKLWEAPINARTALSYDATMTLMEAMARQEKPTRQGTQQQLKAGDFKVDGVTGVIEFCPNKGDRQNPPATLVKVQKKSNNNGLEFVPVEDFNRDSLDLQDCP